MNGLQGPAQPPPRVEVHSRKSSSEVFLILWPRPLRLEQQRNLGHQVRYAIGAQCPNLIDTTGGRRVAAEQPPVAVALGQEDLKLPRLRLSLPAPETVRLG